MGAHIRTIQALYATLRIQAIMRDEQKREAQAASEQIERQIEVESTLRNLGV
jgi:hypothetical protein